MCRFYAVPVKIIKTEIIKAKKTDKMQNVKLESGDWVCCPSDKDKWEYLRWSAALPATKKYMPVVLTDKILESNGFERQDVGVFRLKRRRQVELRKSRGFFMLIYLRKR